MKPRILQALLAEQFLRTWPFLAGTLVLGIAIRFVFQNDWEYMTAVRNQLSIQTMIAIGFASMSLLYGAADSDKWTCAMPQSLLRLPVSTFTLVLTRFGFNLVAVAALTMCFVGYEIVFVDEIPNWSIYPIVFACAFAILQVCAYAFGGLGDWSLGILSAVSAPFFVITDWRHSPGVSLPVAAVVIGVSFLAAWAIVHAQRQGRWGFTLRGRSVRTVHDLEKIRPFRSKYTAQFWFEVVRIRSYIPMVLVGLIAAYIFYFRFFLFAGTNAVRPSALELYKSVVAQLPMLVPCTAVLSGAFVAFQNYRLQFGPMAAFFYLRPISSADLGAIRVLGALACVASAFIGIEVIMLPTDFPQFDLQGSGQIFFTANAMWIGFWVVNGLAILSGIVAFLGITGAFHNTDYAFDDFTLTIIGIVVLTAVLIGASHRRLIAGKFFVPVLILAFVLLALILTSIFNDGTPLDTGDDVETVSTIFFYMLLALAPFATVPLILDRARHR